ncbi:hypothetical protein SAMN05446935_10131 [Burkholderia sp. YR290]|nr:hypothetical protein SAMN05446934_6126 [Paraburkholderia hospita]SOE90812.1 hypothetical protein SAMN05446935_10131 [Burkholderia sp. YR290]
MKKVERTRRARKRCACASPRTSNDAPVRSARPVVSDRMRHARACCGAPSRRSGGRRVHPYMRSSANTGRLDGEVQGAGTARKWVTSIRNGWPQTNHSLRSPISSTGMRGVSNAEISARIPDVSRPHGAPSRGRPFPHRCRARRAPLACRTTDRANAPRRSATGRGSRFRSRGFGNLHRVGETQ